MEELIKSILAAPIGVILILAGLCFLAIAVVGNISGRIEPGTPGRIGAGVLGATCLAIGLLMQWPARQPAAIVEAGRDQPAAARTPSPADNKPNPQSSDQTPSSQNPSQVAKTDEIQRGDWGFKVGAMHVLSEYNQVFQTPRILMVSKDSDHKFVVIRFELRNLTMHTHMPDFDDGNIGLIDDANRSYVPVDWDMVKGGEGWSAHIGSAVLPNTVYEAAMVFSIPKDRTPRQLQFTIKSHDGEQPPGDVLVELPPPS